MSKLKIIFIVIISAIAICLTDNIFSREEYLKGIVIKKGYRDKMIITATGNNTRRGHTVVNTPTYDPNGYIIFIKDKDGDQIVIRSNRDTYTKAYKGDSIKYRLSKGFFSRKIWTSSIVEVIPNFENRKQFLNKKLSPLERFLKNNR